MIFSVKELDKRSALAVSDVFSSIGFPDKDMEVVDALDWIQWNVEDDKKWRLARIFGEWEIFFGMNKIELEKFNETFEIDDKSTKILKSYKVSDSSRVKESKKVINSSFVDISIDIKDSKYIYNSTSVNNSTEVFNSSDIENSNEIIFSDSIKGSVDVGFSSFVTDSKSIFNAKNIQDSIGVFDGEENKEVYFSAQLYNCNHCLFCHSLTNESFCLFNRKIDPKNWFVIKELILQKWEKEANAFKIFSFEDTHFEWCGKEENTKIGPNGSAIAQRKYFYKISNELIEYLKTVPYYNKWLLYKLTFNPANIIK